MPEFTSFIEEKTFSSKTPQALRTIGETAKILDVPQHVLRFWEGKFSHIVPIKRRNRRYYRPQDIEILQNIKKLLYKEGYTIKGVQRYFAQCEENPVFLNEKIPIKQNTSFVQTRSYDFDALEKLLTRLEYIQKSLHTFIK